MLDYKVYDLAKSFSKKITQQKPLTNVYGYKNSKCLNDRYCYHLQIIIYNLFFKSLSIPLILKYK